jgi:hypothetical protein
MKIVSQLVTMSYGYVVLLFYLKCYKVSEHDINPSYSNRVIFTASISNGRVFYETLFSMVDLFILQIYTESLLFASSVLGSGDRVMVVMMANNSLSWYNCKGMGAR